MAYRTFLDFVSARGDNVIRAWLHDEIPKEARAEINAQIASLRNVRNLERPDAGHMKGRQCRGLIELRITANRVRYRPLCYYGPARGQVTILIGAIEKGGKLEPRNACETARARIAQIESRRATVREHEFD